MLDYVREYTAFTVWRSVRRAPEFVMRLWQNHRFKIIVKNARTKVPFYEERYKDCASDISLSDLEQLPIVSRADLKRAGFERTYVKGLSPWAYRVGGTTSGSTGEPLQFFCTPFGGPYTDIERMYSYHKSWRFLLRRGYSLHKILNNTRMVHLRCGRTSSDPLHLSFFVDDLYTKPEALFDLIRSFGGDVFASYATFVIDFCRMLEEKGLVGTVTFPYTTTTGEMLYPAQRAYIERILETKVIERFGMEEFYWTLAAEEEPGEGLVGYAESYLFEIVDEEGHACREGETGRLLVTDLMNMVMPFIRYETGDLAVLIDGKRVHKRFRIVGRDKYLSFPRGKVNHFQLNGVLSRYAEHIVQYQFVKHSNTKLEALFVLRNGMPADLKRTLVEVLRAAVGGDVEVCITCTDHISRTDVGKTGVFVDRTK